MFKFSILILSLILVKLTKSVIQDDLCVLNKKTCINDESSFKEIKCAKIDCDSKLSFKCGTGYCALNNKVCTKFLDRNYRLSYKSVLSFKNQKLYSDFIQNIKPCPTEYKEWQPNFVCIKKKECLNNRYNYYSFGFKIINRKSYCNCNKNYNYTCENPQFCSVNQTACDGLEFNIQENINKLKFCE